MREIKFRAWHKEAKAMFQVDGLSFINKYVTDERGQHTWKLNEVELMEYMGVKDCKGKEIYEGDIVTYLKDIGDKNEEVDYVVELDLDSLHFFNFVDDGVYLCKVIGNIYEHPELIKE